MRWLEALHTAHVVVVGDVMLDRYWSGPARRISPEAPVPVVRITEHEERIGGAGNVAANAAALGVRVSLVGVVGTDPAADSLRELCRKHHIEDRFVALSSVATTVKLRVLAQHQQLLRLDFEHGEVTVPADLTAPFQVALPFANAVVFSDYAKGALTQASALIRLVKQAGKTIVVDPKGTDFARYAGADVITPNLHEFETVVGPCKDDTELVVRAQALCARHAFGAVVITRGDRGLVLIRADGSHHLHPTRARDVFDVTGAGDTVCATLACLLAVQVPLEQAVEIANLAAGLVVAKLGTAVVTRDELADALGQRARSASNILDRDGLRAAVSAARQRGERVVMTNGCFDILHAGHVRYLEAAAALGDRLIVAVNSDASVARIKGAGRPLNALSDRLEVLCRLRAVDWVIAFDADTPRDLIAEVLPDFLVKGGDYQIDQIAGGKEVLAAGGRVLALPYHAGFSSSKTIARARTLGVTPV